MSEQLRPPLVESPDPRRSIRVEFGPEGSMILWVDGRVYNVNLDTPQGTNSLWRIVISPRLQGLHNAPTQGVIQETNQFKE